jgi:hypothetical protein
MAQSPELKKWLARYDAARKAKKRGVREAMSLVNNTVPALNAAFKENLIDQRGYDERLKEYNDTLSKLSKIPVSRGGALIEQPNGKPLTHIAFVKNGVYQPTGNFETTVQDLYARKAATQKELNKPSPNEAIETLRETGPAFGDVASGIPASMQNTGVKLQALGQTKTVTGPDGKPQVMIRPFQLSDPEEFSLQEPRDYVPAEELAKNIIVPESDAQAAGMEIGAGLADVVMNPFAVAGLAQAGGYASKKLAKYAIKPALASGAVQAIPIVGGMASTLANDPRYNVFDPLSAAAQWKPKSAVTEKLLQAESTAMQRAPLARAGTNVIGNVMQAGAFGTKGFLNEGVASLKKGRDAVREIKATQIATAKSSAQSGLATQPFKKYSPKAVAGAVLKSMDETGQIPSNVMWAAASVAPTATKAIASMAKPYDPKTGSGYMAPTPGEWLQVLAGAAILRPSEGSIIGRTASSAADVGMQAEVTYKAAVRQKAAVDGLFNDFPIVKTIQERTGLSKDESLAYINLWFEDTYKRQLTEADLPILKQMSGNQPYPQSFEKDSFAGLAGYKGKIWKPELLKKVMATKQQDVANADANGMEMPTKHEDAMHKLMGPFSYASKATEREASRQAYSDLKKYLATAKTESGDVVLDQANKALQKLPIGQIVLSDAEGNVKRVGLDPNLLFAFDISKVEGEALYTVDASTQGKVRTGIDIDKIPGTIKNFPDNVSWQNKQGNYDFVYTTRGFDAGGVYITTRFASDSQAKNTFTMLAGRDDLKAILPDNAGGQRILDSIEQALALGGNELQDKVDNVALEKSQASADRADFESEIYIDRKKFRARLVDKTKQDLWYQIPNGGIVRVPIGSQGGTILRTAPRPPLSGRTSNARLYGWTETVLDQVTQRAVPAYVEVLLDENDRGSLRRIYLTDIQRAKLAEVKANYIAEMEVQAAAKSPDRDKVMKDYKQRITQRLLNFQKHGDDDMSYTYIGNSEPISIGDFVVVKSSENRTTPLGVDEKRAIVVSMQQEGIGVKLAGDIEGPTVLLHKDLLVPLKVDVSSPDDILNIYDAEKLPLNAAGPAKGTTAADVRAQQESAQGAKTAAETKAAEALKQAEAAEFLAQFEDPQDGFIASSVKQLTEVTDIETARTTLQNIQKQRKLTPAQYGDIIYRSLRDVMNENQSVLIDAILSQPATDPSNVSSVIRQNEAIKSLARWVDEPGDMILSDDASEILFFSNPPPDLVPAGIWQSGRVNDVAYNIVKTFKGGNLQAYTREILDANNVYKALSLAGKQKFSAEVSTRVEQMRMVDLGLSSVLQQFTQADERVWRYVSQIPWQKQLDVLVGLTLSDNYSKGLSENSFKEYINTLGGKENQPDFTARREVVKAIESYKDLVKFNAEQRKITAEAMLADSANFYASSGKDNPDVISSAAVKYFADNLKPAARVKFIESLLGTQNDSVRKQIGEYLASTTMVSDDITLKDLMDFASANKIQDLTVLQQAMDTLARGVQAQVAVSVVRNTVDAQGVQRVASRADEVKALNSYFDSILDDEELIGVTQLQDTFRQNRDKYIEEYEKNGIQDFMSFVMSDITNVFKDASVSSSAVTAIENIAKQTARTAFESSVAAEMENKSAIKRTASPDGFFTPMAERPMAERQATVLESTQKAISRLAEIMVENTDDANIPNAISRDEILQSRKTITEMATWLRSFGKIQMSEIDFSIPLPSDAVTGPSQYRTGELTELAKLKESQSYRIGDDGRVVLTKYGATNRLGMAEVFKKTLGFDTTDDASNKLVKAVADDLALMWDMNARSYAMRVMDYELQYGNRDASEFYIRVLDAVKKASPDESIRSGVDVIKDFLKSNNTLMEVGGNNPRSVIESVFEFRNKQFGRDLSEFLRTHRLAQLTNDFYTTNAKLMAGGVDPTAFTPKSRIKTSDAFIQMSFDQSPDVGRRIVNMMIHMNRSRNSGRNAFTLAHEVFHGLVHTMPWKAKRDLAIDAMTWGGDNYNILKRFGGDNSIIKEAVEGLNKEFEQYKKDENELSKAEFDYKYNVDVANEDSITYKSPFINELVVAYLTNMTLGQPTIYNQKNYALSPVATSVFKGVGDRLGIALKFVNDAMSLGSISVDDNKPTTRWTLGSQAFYSEVDGKKIHTPLNKGWAVRFAISDETKINDILVPLVRKADQFFVAGGLTPSSRPTLAKLAPVFNRFGNRSLKDLTVTVEDAVYAPPSDKQSEILRSATFLNSASATNVEGADLNNTKFVRINQLIDGTETLRYQILEEGKPKERSVDLNKGSFGYVVSLKDDNGNSFYYLMKDSALGEYGTRVAGTVSGFSPRSASVLYDLYGGAKKHIQALSNFENFSSQVTSEAVMFASLNSDTPISTNMFGVLQNTGQRGFDPANFNVPEVVKSQVNATDIIARDGIQNELDWSNALTEGMKDAKTNPDAARDKMIALQGVFNNIRLAMFGSSPDGFAQSTTGNKTNNNFYGMKDSNGLLSAQMTHLVGDPNTDERLFLRKTIADGLLGMTEGAANQPELIMKLATLARTAGVDKFTEGALKLGIDQNDLRSVLTPESNNPNREYSAGEAYAAMKEVLLNEVPFGYAPDVNGNIDGTQVLNYLNRLSTSDTFKFANVRNQNIVLSHVMKRFMDAYPNVIEGNSMTELLTKLSNPLGKDADTYTKFVSFAQRLNADAAFRARALREWRKYEIVDFVPGRGNTPWVIIAETGGETTQARKAVTELSGTNRLIPFYAVNPDDGRVMLAQKSQFTDKWSFVQNPDITNVGSSLYQATALLRGTTAKSNLSNDEKLFGIVVENPVDGSKRYPNEVYFSVNPDPNETPGSSQVGKFLDKDNLDVQKSQSLKTIAAALQYTQQEGNPNSYTINIPLPFRRDYIDGNIDVTTKFKSFVDVINATRTVNPNDLVTLRSLEVTWQKNQNRWKISDKGIPFTEDIALGRHLQLADIMSSSNATNVLGISLPEVHISKILSHQLMMGDKNAPLYKKLESITGGSPNRRTVMSKLSDPKDTWGRTLFSEELNPRDIEKLMADPSLENVQDAIDDAINPVDRPDFARIVEVDPSLPPDQVQVVSDQNGVWKIITGTQAVSWVKGGAKNSLMVLNEVDSLVRILKLSGDLSAMANQSYLNANWATDLVSLSQRRRPEMLTSLMALTALAPNMPNLRQSVENPKHALSQFGGTAFGDKQAHLAVDRLLNAYPDLTMQDFDNYGLNLEYLKFYNQHKEALLFNPDLNREDLPLNMRFDDMLGEGRITALAKKFAPFLNQFERTNTLYRDMTKIVAFQNAHQELQNVAAPPSFPGKDSDWRNLVLKDIAWSINFLGGNDGGEFSSNRTLQAVQSKFGRLFMSAPYAKTRMVLNPLIGPTLWAAKSLANKIAGRSGSSELINTGTERKVWGRDLDSYAKVYIHKQFWKGVAASAAMPTTLRLIKALALAKAVGFTVEDKEELKDGKFIIDTSKDAVQGMMTFTYKDKVYSSSMPGALGRIARQSLKPFTTQNATIPDLANFYMKQYFENSLSPLASLLKTAATGKDFDGRAAFEQSAGYKELKKYLVKNYGEDPVAKNILNMYPDEMSRFATELAFNINALSVIDNAEERIDIREMMFEGDDFKPRDEDFDDIPMLLTSNMFGLNLGIQTANEKNYLDKKDGETTNRTRLKNMRNAAKYRGFADVIKEEGITGVISGYREGGVNR